MRSPRGKEFSITGKPSADAGRELHKPAKQGMAQRFGCHEAFTIMQVFDFQGYFYA
jgi:hypothetical protein